MRRWVIFVLMLSVGGVAFAQTWIIEPDKGVGPLQFGQSRDEVVRILSAWQARATSDYLAVQDKLGIEFTDGQLSSITVASPALFANGRKVTFKTREGLKVGDRAKAFIEIYKKIHDAGGG